MKFAAQATRPGQAEYGCGQEEDSEMDEQLHSSQQPNVRHHQNLCNRIAALALCLLLDGKLICPAPKLETLALYRAERTLSKKKKKGNKETIY